MSPKARVCEQGLLRGLPPPTHTLASEAPPTGHWAAVLQMAHPGPLTILVHPDC